MNTTAQQAEEEQLEMGTAHEAQLVGVDQELADHRAVTIVAPPASTTALPP